MHHKNIYRLNEVQKFPSTATAHEDGNHHVPDGAHAEGRIPRNPELTAACSGITNTR